MTAAFRERLTQLSQHVEERGFAAYILPSSDPHLSEYVPERYKAIRWLTGFDGSAGTLVVMPSRAALWVDSRYWDQAERQLEGTGVETMRLQHGNGTYAEWLAECLRAGQSVGVDPALVSSAQYRAMAEQLGQSGISLHSCGGLVEEVWSNRPNLPASTIYEHSLDFAVRTRREKLGLIRQAMEKAQVDWYLTSALDDIAWLSNLRASDVPFNPVFLAHMLVGTTGAALFVRDGTLSPDVTSGLEMDGIKVSPYDAFRPALEWLPENACILVDSAKTPAATIEGLAVNVVDGPSICTQLKATKSPGEADGIRAAMVNDGVALAEFFCWLERTVANEAIAESDLDTPLTSMRTRRPGFVSRSFSTIAAFGPSAALPHYVAVPGADRQITGDGLLLIDSGGHYLGGTTDITRMVAIGTPSAEQKRDVTLALKGMIALSRAVFPSRARPQILDGIARAPLWAHGIDFGHGTGHGVGHFLNVHEGPQNISYMAPWSATNFIRPGMVTSIEPGIYRPRKWGVRVENLVLCVKHRESEFGDFLEFETLTLCPIDTRCIDFTVLDATEVAWLDAYHAVVWERLAPHVEGAARTWLRERTLPRSAA